MSQELLLLLQLYTPEFSWGAQQTSLAEISSQTPVPKLNLSSLDVICDAKLGSLIEERYANIIYFFNRKEILRIQAERSSTDHIRGYTLSNLVTLLSLTISSQPLELTCTEYLLMIDLGDCAIFLGFKQDLRVVGESQTKGTTEMLDKTRNSLRGKLR